VLLWKDISVSSVSFVLVQEQPNSWLVINFPFKLKPIIYFSFKSMKLLLRHADFIYLFICFNISLRRVFLCSFRESILSLTEHDDKQVFWR
jgi:hypothetical protein